MHQDLKLDAVKKYADGALMPGVPGYLFPEKTLDYASKK